MSFGAGGSDVYVIKTDAFGDTLWTKVDGTTLNDSINGVLYVQQTSDSGYIISGYIVTDYSDSLGEFTTDIYVIKTDSNGNVYCGKNFNSTNTLVNNTSTQVVKSTSSSIVSTGSSVKKTSELIGDTSTLINNLANDGPVQPICLITVDSTSTKNVIVREKPVSAGIDSFKIYREITTNTTNTSAVLLTVI